MTQGTCHARNGETTRQVAAGRARSSREVWAPSPASVHLSVPLLCLPDASGQPSLALGHFRLRPFSASAGSHSPAILREQGNTSLGGSSRRQRKRLSPQGQLASNLLGSDWLTLLSLNQSLRPSEFYLHRRLRTGQRPCTASAVPGKAQGHRGMEGTSLCGGILLCSPCMVTGPPGVH